MCQAVNDTKVVDLFPWLTVFMGGSETPIIAVEDEVFTLLQHFVWHFTRTLVHRYGLLALDDLS